jgi:sigma-B regulation protein RsbU (phosphoserine phosphatase)
MIAPAIPNNEAERLAAVHALQILDTPAEERFDRVARLAAQIFNVPIAYVALIDSNRQWFKAVCGLTVSETGRDVSFCGHTILQSDTLVVPDTLLDARFRKNPLVTGEPHLRFYAGHPLTGPDGHKVGTLCIADRQPRELSAKGRQTLRELAALVERELDLTDVIRLQSDLLAAKEQAATAERAKAEYLGHLVESQQHLARELADAARYVRSLLPARLEGEVKTDWRFQPCSQLGGDAFGYHWIDADHLAIYLLDVCGHGVGSALLSISVMNTLRGESLPRVDFREPAEVLAGLNQAFPMAQHDDRFFTIWYGVFDRASRQLTYAAAGHPPAVLRTGPTEAGARTLRLGTESVFIGLDLDTRFASKTVPLERFSKLFVFSDGTFEIARPDGNRMHLDDLVACLSAPSTDGESDLERAYRYACAAGASDAFADDFSLLEVVFGLPS